MTKAPQCTRPFIGPSPAHQHQVIVQLAWVALVLLVPSTSSAASVMDAGVSPSEPEQTKPSDKSLSEELLTFLQETPQVVAVETASAWGTDCRKTAAGLGVVRLSEADHSWVCLFDAEGYRCRPAKNDEAQASLNYTQVSCKEWSDVALGAAPPYGTRCENLLDRMAKGWPRSSLGARDLRAATKLKALEIFESSPSARTWQISIRDGVSWKMSAGLQLEFYGAVADYPALDASAIFGAPAWGLVLTEGDEGNGNNASGGYSYLVAFFQARDERLELVATRPIGYTSFARSVTDEGFFQSEAHTLLCPSITGSVFRLTPACRGHGEPRAFGLPFRELCVRMRSGNCPPGGAKPDPLVRRWAGDYARRGSVLVPTGAVNQIKDLSAIRVPRDTEDEDQPRAARRTPDVIVSERPWEVTDKQPVEWLELQNNTKLWIDLRGLRLEDQNRVAAEVTDSCIIGPQDVVVVRQGRAPSWNSRWTECFFGDAKLVGHIQLFSGERWLADSWSTYGAGAGYSMQVNAKGGFELAKQSPGVPNRTGK